MKRTCFYFSLLALFFPLSGQAQSTYSPISYYGYYGQYGPSLWSQMTGVDKAFFAINQFFGAVNYTTSVMRSHKAYEQQLMMRSNKLEEYKSLQRYYYEGIPAFSPLTPSGKPRNPKITWEDVDSIRLE